MAQMKFKDDGHSYKKGGSPYISVTTLIEDFKQKFAYEHWSSYKAAQQMLSKERFNRIRGRREASDPQVVRDLRREFGGKQLNLFHKIKQEFILDWNMTRDIAATRGTIYHEFKEDQSYQTGTQLNPFTGKTCKTFYKKRVKGYNTGINEDLFQLPDGFYPELVIWNDTYQLAGQADKVFIETTDRRYIDIDDYKTNKVINRKSFWNRTKVDYERMKPPVNHLMDCNYIHYELQISMYAWMLQQFGFVPRNLAFDHLTEKYPLKYRKWEVEKMLIVHNGDI